MASAKQGRADQPATSPDSLEKRVDAKHEAQETRDSDVTVNGLANRVAVPSNPSSQSTPEPTSSPTKTPDLAAKALKFVSEATPVTIGAIAIAFSAILYAILGSVGLLLIGAGGGVLAFISLEARNPALAQAVRGEQGPEVLDRVWLDLKQARTSDSDSDRDGDDEEMAYKCFDDFRPETRDALIGFVDAVIRDYVKWWYTPIIPGDHAFPLACRKTLNSYLLSISNRMARKRPADAFLDLLTNSSSILIALLSELASAFADLPPETNMTAADAVYNYLASNPDSRLANLLNQKQQSAKFKMVAEDLLGFLDQGSQNCEPARLFLREILANSVLESTLQTCSKAEWINGWIVYLLEAGEPDINQAIDVGMQTGRDTGPPVFADIEGNVGNISVAKAPAARSNSDQDRSRRKEALGHRKKLSRADEELEEAMEGGRSADASVTRDGGPRRHDSLPANFSRGASKSLDLVSEIREQARGSLEVRNGTTPYRPEPNGIPPDGFSSVEIAPPTPRSTLDPSSQQSSPRRPDSQQFTTFEQVVPMAQADEAEEDGPRKVPLTLHNASFTIHDDSDDSKIRAKPNWDYLIQVEPSSSAHTGWMIVRRYSDFETLHEILRRIATISGATAFTELHKELPSWKIHTRESLRGELERYLRDSCWYQSLAESEGMKRFLEKSQGHSHGHTKSFGLETVGKNMLGVLTTAPKGAMEGGKTLVGGVFGNIAGLGRKSTSQSMDLTSSSSRLSISTPPRMDMTRSPARSERASMDSQRSSIISTQPGKMAPMSRRPSYQSQGDVEGDFGGDSGRDAEFDAESSPPSARASKDHSRASSLAALRSPSTVSLDYMKLPPPPDDMPSDYDSINGDEVQPRQTDVDQTSRKIPNSVSTPSLPTINGTKKSTTKPAAKPTKQYPQMTEPETRVAVELLFAVINEMYTLSSAWNIRRTLLTAAKSFLLRPGNPSLLTVQSLIQSSVLDANTSDTGIATQVRKLRENTMPTDEERAAWPAEMTADEKEKLAVKARKLLIKSGVPAALMGVMGQAATGEALGRVFDCLQIEEVARGLIFGLILQAVRIVTH